MTRYIVWLRQTPKGWEWCKRPGQGWWGPYRTRGIATAAAMRSITKVIGAKINRDDFTFEEQEIHHG